MAEIALGIDLGTSNSCVAISRRGRVDVLPNAFGEGTTSSVVNLSEDGSITVGNAAKANVIHDPINTIYSSKRLMGRYYFSEEVKKAQAICSYNIVEGENNSVRIQVRDEVFSLPEISAMILRELKSIAESRLGQPATKAVVTVPAYFNDNQRQATKDAARIAGLDVLRILNEPTAAALAYGFGRDLNQRVAVYDLGGGTFDISVLEIGEDVFEVLATSGDTFLGGDDFDDRVIDLLADEFMATQKINLRNDPYALEKLKVAAEDAKKALSLDQEVDIRIPDIAKNEQGELLSIERTLTSEEFTALVMDLLQRSFKVCDEALQQSSLVARDLDGVILVGGPTRLPVVREGVREYFQQEPLDAVDPDEVVAMGAAIHAASLVDSDENDAYLLDVTPLSLQIGVAGGITEPVIERNTPVPIEQTRTFTTFKDHQESVKIRVYQGESRETSENEGLGEFEFSGFEKGRRGEVQIDVTFEINTDGIVNVTARDCMTGHEASTRITLSSGLSEEEMNDILERGVADRVDTAEIDDDQALVAVTPPTETQPAAVEAAVAAALMPSSPEPAAAPLPLTPEPDALDDVQFGGAAAPDTIDEPEPLDVGSLDEEDYDLEIDGPELEEPLAPEVSAAPTPEPTAEATPEVVASPMPGLMPEPTPSLALETEVVPPVAPEPVTELAAEPAVAPTVEPAPSAAPEPQVEAAPALEAQTTVAPPPAADPHPFDVLLSMDEDTTDEELDLSGAPTDALPLIQPAVAAHEPAQDETPAPSASMPPLRTVTEDAASGATTAVSLESEEREAEIVLDEGGEMEIDLVELSDEVVTADTEIAFADIETVEEAPLAPDDENELFETAGVDLSKEG